MSLAIFRLRKKSLLRGAVLALSAFFVSLRLAGFPNLANLHGSRWQLACLLFAIWGMVEIARCLQRRWNFYHGGVLLLLYTDLIIMAMIVLFSIYP